jgi:hypothetical protein
MYNAKKLIIIPMLQAFLSGQQHGGEEIDLGLALNSSH